MRISPQTRLASCASSPSRNSHSSRCQPASPPAEWTLSRHRTCAASAMPAEREQVASSYMTVFYLTNTRDFAHGHRKRFRRHHMRLNGDARSGASISKQRAGNVRRGIAPAALAMFPVWRRHTGVRICISRIINMFGKASAAATRAVMHGHLHCYLIMVKLSDVFGTSEEEGCFGWRNHILRKIFASSR